MPVHLKDRQEILYQRDQYAMGGIGRFYWDYRDRVVLDQLGRNDHVIADIGCGEGITTERVARLFPDKKIFGVDRLLENLQICSDHRIVATGGEIDHLPFLEGSIDCVLLLEVLEHIEHTGIALAEIRRVLKPYGKMVLLVPNDNIFKIARLLTLKFKEAYYDPGHVKKWNPMLIKQLLSDQGFRILRRQSVPFKIWCLSLHHLVVCEKNS